MYKTNPFSQRLFFLKSQVLFKVLGQAYQSQTKKLFFIVLKIHFAKNNMEINKNCGFCVVKKLGYFR